MTKPFLRKSACGKTTLKERAEKWAFMYSSKQGNEDIMDLDDLQRAFMAGWNAHKRHIKREFEWKRR